MGNHRARRLRLRRVVGIAVLAATGLAATFVPPVSAASGTPAGDTPDVPSPEVTGPVAGTPWSVSPTDYAQRGYTQQEFFLHGTARSYLNDGAWGDDGRWNAKVNPDAEAPYTTRILVRRPSDPAAFNGTVVVEWMNVSAGFDVEPDYVWTRNELMRRGYAYVGVSAQAVGVNHLRGNNPTRYSGLAHPGDAFSYDMFSQAAMAAISPADGGPQPLGDITDDVERVLADGESQSGGRLITYVNSVHPLVRLFDGFLIHSAAGGAALSQPSAAGAPTTPSIPGGDVPRPTARIRTDREEPVLLFNTETDVVPFSNLGPSGIHEQPDAATLRIWEVTGTSHVDTQLVGNLDCGGAPVNDGPENYALSAALRHLDRWVSTGRPAPRGARITVTDGAVVRDAATGLAKGGIRLPDVTVPTRTLSGSRPSGTPGGNLFCILAGARDPWNGDADPWDGQAGIDPSPTPEPVLSELYPSHEDYVRRVTVATLIASLRGYVLPQDTTAIVETARNADVPS
jgi:hypothetical protein